MNDETMPDWVLIEAAKRFEYNLELTAAYWAQRSKTNSGFRALCDMILKHEQPPVDRKLLCAREACAQVYEGNGMPTAAAAYRAGNYDDDSAMRSAMRATELWEKRQ